MFYITLGFASVYGGEVSTLKRTFPLISSIIAGAVVGFLLSSLFYSVTGFSLFGGFREKPLTTEDVNNENLSALAYRVLDDIKDNDYIALSRLAHPESGVLFSPKATVDKSTNKRFSAAEIASFGTDTNVYIWGVYGESGEPIEMTPADYFAKFVFCKDYTTAPVVGIDHIIRSGNALENITDVFPDMRFVEFYFPAEEQEQAGDSSWYTLRLGFEEHDGSLWLAAIIHSRWSA